MAAVNAANTQVRRPVPSQRAAAAARTPAPAAAVVADFDHDEDEFVLNLSDIPRMRTSLDVEGLKPTLLSRLFDLIAPLKA
jgi:hypothetical protein